MTREPGRFTAAELVARHRALPRVDGPELRAEADELFGTEDRLPIDDFRTAVAT